MKSIVGMELINRTTLTAAEFGDQVVRILERRLSSATRSFEKGLRGPHSFR